jgi:AcrR family transcriptional regulator
MAASGGSSSSDVRGRIVRTAHDLFSRHGLRAVGVDQIIDEAGVAKATLYRHFPSKVELAVAVIEHRREIWTRGWLQRVTEERDGGAQERLVFVFDTLGEWLQRSDHQGSMFVSMLLEAHDPTSPVAVAAVAGIDEIGEWLHELATEAGARDPVALAQQLMLLMRGAIVAAAEGRADAGAQIRATAAILVAGAIDP